MTLNVQLPPEKEAAFKAQAEMRGLSIEQWLVEVAEEHLQPTGSIAHLQVSDPKEWARRFHAWAESHDRSTPLLTDEDLGRDSIYPDRI
jgi:hypothetical protein